MLIANLEWQGNGETPDVANFSESDEDWNEIPEALSTHETVIRSVEVEEAVKISTANIPQAKWAKKPTNKTLGPKGPAGIVVRRAGNRPTSKSIFVERDNNAKAAYRRRQPHTGERASHPILLWVSADQHLQIGSNYPKPTTK